MGTEYSSDVFAASHRDPDKTSSFGCAVTEGVYTVDDGADRSGEGDSWAGIGLGYTFLSLYQGPGQPEEEMMRKGWSPLTDNPIDREPADRVNQLSRQSESLYRCEL